MTDPILDNSTLALAIMTGVLAVATVVLAFATFWTSKLARADADVQHRQALSGALTCNELIFESYESLESRVLYVGGPFTNIGNGPVVNASLILKLPARPDFVLKWNLGSYSSGEERQSQPFDQSFERELATPLSESDWDGATLVLEYKSIFSRPQRTDFTAVERYNAIPGYRIAFRSSYISGFERVPHT